MTRDGYDRKTFPRPTEDWFWEGVICEECGDDLATEGYTLCTDCLELFGS